MTEANRQSEVPPHVEKLAEHVVGAIRELRSKRYPVTQQSVAKIISERKAILDLLSEKTPSDGEGDGELESLEPAPATVADHLHTQLQILGDQKTRLLNDVTRLEEQFQELWEFTTASLVTFAVWVESTNRKSSFTKALKSFKKQLRKSESPSSAYDAFERLKEKVFREDLEPEGGDSRRSESRFSFKSLLKGKGEEIPEGPSEEELLEQIKSLLCAFLDRFGGPLPDVLMKEVTELRRVIEECENLEALITLRERFLRLGQIYVRCVEDEREQFGRLVKEIDENLGEIEKNLLDSAGDTKEMIHSNSAFDAQLEQRMDEINESAATSTNLEDLRSVVVTKLTTVRGALEAKRKEDEQRLEAINKRMEQLQENVGGMRQEISLAREQTKQLEKELQTDVLTGALSRRGYEDRVLQEFERYRRYGHVLSLIVFDIDRFKQINDQYGHQMGDRCLRVISKYIRQVIRKSDSLARYGGDEFVLILPGIDQEEAVKVAEKVRKLVEQMRIMYAKKKLPLTLSLGVAQSEQTDENPEDLFNRADEALYQAKEGGRNRVEVLPRQS